MTIDSQKVRENIRLLLQRARDNKVKADPMIELLKQTLEMLSAKFEVAKGEPGVDADPLDYEKLRDMVLEKLPTPEKGDPGYTPIKGKDYFDGEDGNGEDGEDGQDGLTPREGIHYIDIRKRPEFVKTAISKMSDKIAPYILRHIKPTHILDRLTKIDFKTEEGRRLKSFIASGGFNMDDQRWHGAGSGSGKSTSLNVQTISGIIDGVNTSFSVPLAFKGTSVISINGQIWVQGVDYTVGGVGTTITTTTPPDITLAGTTFVLICTI